MLSRVGLMEWITKIPLSRVVVAAARENDKEEE